MWETVTGDGGQVSSGRKKMCLMRHNNYLYTCIIPLVRGGTSEWFDIFVRTYTHIILLHHFIYYFYDRIGFVCLSLFVLPLVLHSLWTLFTEVQTIWYIWMNGKKNVNIKRGEKPDFNEYCPSHACAACNNSTYTYVII